MKPRRSRQLSLLNERSEMKQNNAATAPPAVEWLCFASRWTGDEMAACGGYGWRRLPLLPQREEAKQRNDFSSFSLPLIMNEMNNWLRREIKRCDWREEREWNEPTNLNGIVKWMNFNSWMEQAVNWLGNGTERRGADEMKWRQRPAEWPMRKKINGIKWNWFYGAVAASLLLFQLNWRMRLSWLWAGGPSTAHHSIPESKNFPSFQLLALLLWFIKEKTSELVDLRIGFVFLFMKLIEEWSES